MLIINTRIKFCFAPSPILKRTGHTGTVNFKAVA